jgi:LuxR family maltose regulon positive regulatory protein
MSFCAAGRAHFLLGDLAQARTWLTRALATPGAQYSVYRVHILGSLALVEAWSGRLGLAQSQADEALALARDVGLLQHPAPADAYLALAVTAIERGDPLGAAFTLHEGIARAASNQRTQLLWIGHLLRALTLAGDDGETEQPPPVSPPPIVRARLAALTATRSAAATRSGVAVVGPVGPASGSVLTEPRTGTHQADPIAWDLAEPLTDRERELLAYLPSRLTNAELAARCFVSVNTIKTHMAHIYRKLDAPNRDAAIARAQSLGLL